MFPVTSDRFSEPHSFLLCLCHRYVSWLVYDFVPGMDQDRVGLYAGFVAGAFHVGQFISCSFWGLASDRYGRKPMLMIGCVSTLVATVLFGFATNIWWCVAARFMMGLLNGNTGIAKSLVGEVSNGTNQARAFGLLGIAWSAGSIIGSLVGGILARIATKVDALQGSFLATYPYLLPNVCTASVLALGFVLTAWKLEEPRRVAPKTDEGRGEEGFFRGLVWVFRQPQVVLAGSMYVLMGGISTFVWETYPLFFVALPASGGLSFSTTKIGILNGSISVFGILWQLFAFGEVVKLVGGVVNSYRLGITVFSLTTLLVPLSGYLISIPPVLWIYLIVLYALCIMGGECSYSSSFTIIANSVSKDKLGRVNGVAQSLVGLLRGPAPVAAGRAFAWALTVNIFPINVWFCFFLQALLFVLLLLLSFMLDPSLKSPKPQEDPMEDTELAEIPK
jgi:MFS family permease